LNKFELYKKLILKYCGYPSRILDIGCGKGKELSKYFTSSDYTGVDKVFGDDVVYGQNHLIGKCDLIVLSEIIEHLPIRLRLPPAKYFFVVFPNDYNLVARIKFLFGHTIDENALTDNDKHLHYPTLSQTDRFVRHNWKVIHKSYFSDNFFLPDSFLTWLANLCPTLFARGVIYICQNLA
jgi:hypothetical protein